MRDLSYAPVLYAVGLLSVLFVASSAMVPLIVPGGTEPAAAAQTTPRAAAPPVVVTTKRLKTSSFVFKSPDLP